MSNTNGIAVQSVTVGNCVIYNVDIVLRHALPQANTVLVNTGHGFGCLQISKKEARYALESARSRGVKVKCTQQSGGLVLVIDTQE
jgi:hypothetical protein